MAEAEWHVQMAFPSPKKILTPVVVGTVLLMIVGFALAKHRQVFTIDYLALNRQTFFPLRVWQLVTYSLVNLCAGNLVFNGLVILFIGSAIEREWRSRSFLLLMLAVSVVCGLTWLLINLIGGWYYIGTGTGACGYGLIGAFGLLFRRKRFLVFFWSLEAQHLAIMLVVIGLVVGIAQPISWIWVGGALVGRYKGSRAASWILTKFYGPRRT
jgi:membrane associated rhomboid family serine protease